jgi:hypothetical protein
MAGLVIGTVSASVSGVTWAMVDILLTHAGKIVVGSGLNMRE